MKINKIIPIIFGIIIVTGFILKIGIYELINSINNVNKYYLMISVIVILITILIKSVRWYYILKPLDMNDKKIAFGSYFIGQATNEVLPTGSGELARLAILKKYTNKSFMWFSPSIILERLYDMFLLLILSISFAYTTDNGLILLILIPVIGLIGIIFIKPKFIDIPIKLCRFMLSKNILSNFANILDIKLVDIQTGLTSYQKNVKILFTVFILTTVSWIIFETSSHNILLKGFGVDIPYISLLGIVSVSWILGTISFIPGGLGVREVVYAIMLTKFGVALSVGMTMAVVYRAIIYVLFGSLAMISIIMIDKIEEMNDMYND